MGLEQFLHPQFTQLFPFEKHGHLFPVQGSPRVPFVAPVPHRHLSLFIFFLFLVVTFFGGFGTGGGRTITCTGILL
jgi:hypothetical protein